MTTFQLHRCGTSSDLPLSGRPAWLLGKLIQAGKSGLTATDLPAGLRLSGYIHNLRKAGLSIETAYEANKDGFGGSHGRYILRDTVQLVEAET